MERDRRPVSDPASRAGHEQAHQTAVRLPGVAGWMQLVLSKVTDGVIATDAECRITGLNATAQHVTGWTSEEATGRRLHDILRVSAASLTHGALTDDQHLTLPDATVLVGREREHPISGSVSAVLDDNGELAGLILLFRETMPGGGRDAADNPARRAEILSEAITDLVTSSEPESTVCTVLAKVAAHLGVDSFFNYMVDDDQTNQLRLHACAGVSDAARIALERLQFGEGICGMVAQTRESIHATDIQRGEFEPAALVRGLNIQAYACHPLMVSDRVLGTLSFASRSRSAFRDDELHFMRQVTQHVAIVLDRVRTEKKLRESERRYRSVVEGQSEMVCRFRVNGSILFANEAYARSLGTSAAALEGANFWDYIKPDEHQHVRDQLARLSPNEPELQIENHFTTASGLRWTLWTNRALKFDEHGRVLEAQSAGIDITERKAAEQALLDSERRATNAFREIQATYDQSPIGMLQLDRDLRYVRINDQMAAMNGRTVAEHIGRTIHEIVPDLVPHIEPGFRRVLDTGEPVIGIELKGLTAADPGVEHTWLESWYPLREATGAIVGVNVVAQDITERTAAERAVHEHRALLRTTIASIGDAVITTDPSGRVVSMNPVAESLTGWGERDAAGRPLEDVFVILNEDSRATVDNPARRALREGLIVGLANHTILIGRDGAERPIDDSAAPIRAADGTVLGCVLVFRDISERKAAERRIAMSEVRYRTLFELGPVAVYTCDQDGVIREYNRRAAELWGREPIPGDAGERFCGSVRMFTATGELMPHEHCPMAAVLSGELPLVDNGEVHIEQPDGTRVIVNVSIRPLHDEDGRVLGAINCFFDVTDRKQAEQAMARLAAIVTASNDAIISKDLTGRVTTWNAGAERLFGYTAAEAIGQPVTFLFPDGHEDEEEAILARLRRGEVVNYGYETVRRCKDGRHIHVSLTISPMFDADGRIIGAAKVARDISERVVLMQRIAQQSEAISEESRRKDEFLAMLSHELRNPLAPIRSAVHLLRAHEQPGAGSPLQAKALEIIDRQAANLTKLVSDLLEVSRVVSGHIRLEMQTVDLNQVVAHAVETAKPLFEQRGHGLFVRTLVEPVWVSADPTRLEEVFINLLNNAAKYTPDGGRIEVFCELTQPADKVRIRVRDNGIGIELGLLPRIFDLFTQSDRSLARSAGGLGVGLTLAHRLVEMQGGTIEAKSDGPGTGAEFTVTLVPVPRHAAPHQGVMFAPAPAAGLRILVVDDNLDLVTMLSGSLRHRGYEVREAYTGTDGLEIAKDWHPDVVLLDIGLPGLDGYEVATRIRGHASGRTGDQPRLVALTGYGRETDKQLAQEAGFDRHLTKPLDFEELAIVIAGLTKLPRP